jgi:hypothetical protein
METKVVCVKGPAGKYARADEPNTGIWGGLVDDAGNPRNWRGVIWDGTDRNDPRYHFELSKPDARFAFVHIDTRCFLGLDATKHSTDLGTQFYLKPEGETRGGYESPVVYDGNLSGVLSGQVEYDDAQGKYVSCAFAVDVLS